MHHVLLPLWGESNPRAQIEGVIVDRPSAGTDQDGLLLTQRTHTVRSTRPSKAVQGPKREYIDLPPVRRDRKGPAHLSTLDR